ncbi:MAG: hypothetical protein PHV34_05085 [Verrucomicrobiae bacterium]|nr:hypothetical protein [Verrucomicrobiae bacterium]
MQYVPLAILYVLWSLILAFAGRHRKFGFWGYFFCSLLLTPILGLLFVIASAKVPPCACHKEQD